MNKMRIMKKGIAVMLSLVLVLGLAGCSGNKSALNPKKPVTVTVWNYYNGDQLTAFEDLVEEFNSTVGIEKGIVAVSVSQADVNTLADFLLDSIEGKAGAQEIPTLASVYAETAYILDQEDALASFDPYFSEDELSAYIPGFIEEGRFNENNDLMLFPIIKSTEVFSANKTDWEPFAEATGVTLESIQTKEDLTAAAKTYYEWTDAQTPDVLEDGKALYGRDSVGNYLYLGCYQLGHNMFEVENGELTVNLDRDTFKTLWDNYYIPYINGYFGSYAKFRSEDAKTGRILALTSSSASVGYLPTAVTLEDDSSHDIEMTAQHELQFEGAVIDSVVQQGASYCMLKSSEAEQEGAAEFLKWASDPKQNMQFATASGYSPVTIEANTTEAIEEAYTGDRSTAKGQNVLNSLLVCAEAYSTSEAYATKPFQGSKDVRSLLESSFDTILEEDRAAVVAAIEAGSTREEAVAPYSTDEYFDAWFTSICEQVETLTQS